MAVDNVRKRDKTNGLSSSLCPLPCVDEDTVRLFRGGREREVGAEIVDQALEDCGHAGKYTQFSLESDNRLQNRNNIA
jgi:hypothetical protein